MCKYPIQFKTLEKAKAFPSKFPPYCPVVLSLLISKLLACLPMIENSIPWSIPERYELTRVLGVGTYGRVCEAIDKAKDCKVAVKCLRRMFDDLEDGRRMLREVAILARVQHPNIVRMHSIYHPDAIETFDELYIFMERCDSDLKRLFKIKQELSKSHVLTLFADLLTGLKFLHSAGIYHRDLTPANCLCNQNCDALQEIRLC